MPPSTGLASDGKRSSAMTATCTSPAARIGITSHSPRPMRELNDAGDNPEDAAARMRSPRKRALRSTRSFRSGSRNVGRATLPREYGGIIRGVGPGWTRVTRWGLVAIAIAALPLAAKSPLRGVRFVAIAGGAFIAQQLLVARGLAARDPGEPGDLDAIDALTLSRGLGAAMVLGAAIAGPRDRLSYAA